MSLDPYPLLHNPKLTIEQRIEQAFFWLTQPNKCPVPDQGEAAAKCYLLYRWIDGLLTDEQLAQVRAFKPVVNSEREGLAFRWDMSLASAEMYVMATQGHYEYADRQARDVMILWDKQKHLWPPQILNYLRASVFHAYHSYLNGYPSLIDGQVDSVIWRWKQTASSWDWRQWPLRPMESRDDMLALQALLFIARASGHVSFPDYDWASPQRVVMFPGTEVCPLYRILREMGSINPAQRIWK